MIGTSVNRLICVMKELKELPLGVEIKSEQSACLLSFGKRQRGIGR
jgi:hypothetical protein